ncbi:hypothetical protein SLS62_004068 [Diatrype stigma]|uniref:Uncharacterized protein n=1 Tax=Diatrype stigma TaxID=117547 RepID=A0AAN9URG8_9PEZI
MADSSLATLGLAEMSVAYPRRDNSVLGFDPATIRRDAEATRIIVHARYPALVEAFLAHKRTHGSSVEKRVYGAAAWSWRDQVARLVAKRPLAFLDPSDSTLLRDGTYVPHDVSAREWDAVGTELDLRGTGAGIGRRNEYLGLDDYLSYDEIMLGSLLGVSGPSHFINDGNRYNQARRSPHAGAYEPRGVIVGVVGARFERPDRMDSVHCLPPAAKPRQHPELTQIFQDFFFQGSGVRRNPTAAFDAAAYKGRIRVTVDLLLLEANSRGRVAAAAAGASCSGAYLYVVGLGLGVWQIDGAQTRLYVEAFAEALDALDHDELSAIRTLDFAWLSGVPAATQAQVTRAAARRGIGAVKFSRRNPAGRLPAAEADQLLVLSYAWDGNAFPGNEYWMGMLTASGDPAAASMSTISELHNPVMNPGFLQRIEVLGRVPEAGSGW